VPTRNYPEAHILFAGNLSYPGSVSEPTLGWVVRYADNYVSVGNNIPDWRRRIANHQSATTSLTGLKYTWGRGNNLTRIWTKWVNTNTGVIYEGTRFNDGFISTFPNAGPSAPTMTAAESQASKRWYSQVQDACQAFQGGVALGELGETLRMIKSPAKAFRNGLDSFLGAAKKHRRRRGPDRMKAVADTWLEYVYGWAPLINDIDDAMNYLHKRQKQLESPTRTITANGEGREVIITVHSRGGQGSKTFAQVRTTASRKVRYRGAIFTEQQNPQLFTPKSLGVSLDDFVPTAWELMPWSFLIDYFTNIGDILQAFSLRKTKLAWGCRNVRDYTRRENIYLHQAPITEYTPVGVQLLGFEVSGSTGGPTERTYVLREAITSVPLPALQFEVPGVGTKWVNMAALLASRRKFTPF
jgi:hypothetical protein